MMNQVNFLLNNIQKKQIEDCCLEGLTNVRRDNLYRFVMEDTDGSSLVKYFAIGNLDSFELRFIRVCFEQQLLLCSNYKTDETIFLNLFEGTYNEFSINKGVVTFTDGAPAPTVSSCGLTSAYYNSLDDNS